MIRIKKICKFCYGKGYASVLEKITKSGDFLGDQNDTWIKEMRRFCACPKGKGMKKISIKQGWKPYGWLGYFKPLK